MRRKIASLFLVFAFVFALLQVDALAVTPPSVHLNATTNVYNTSDDARNQVNSVGQYPAGDYYVYKQLSDGTTNISRTVATPGAWVNKSAISQTTVPEESTPSIGSEAVAGKTVSSVNLRSGPSTSYSILVKIPLGSPVDILYENKLWSKVQYNGQIGYLNSRYVEESEKTYVSYVNANYTLNVRRGPSSTYDILTKVKRGAKVIVLQKGDGWSKIGTRLTSNTVSTIGFVNSKYLSTTAPVVTPEEITPPSKPRIGIPWTGKENSLVTNTVAAVQKAGGEVVYLSRVYSATGANTQLNKVDGIIFTGGSDIAPSYYGQSDTYSENISSSRDTSDMALMKAALSRNMPILGLCRGMQLLNVASSGSLYQDIRIQRSTTVRHRDANIRYYVYHNINVVAGSRVAKGLGSGSETVNSWHHQGVRRLGTNLKVTSRANDNLIESIERTDKEWVVGVQYHPEYHVSKGETKHLQLFKDLVSASAN